MPDVHLSGNILGKKNSLIEAHMVGNIDSKDNIPSIRPSDFVPIGMILYVE